PSVLDGIAALCDLEENLTREAPGLLDGELGEAAEAQKPLSSSHPIEVDEGHAAPRVDAQAESPDCPIPEDALRATVCAAGFVARSFDGELCKLLRHFPRRISGPSAGLVRGQCVGSLYRKPCGHADTFFGEKQETFAGYRRTS